MYSLDQVKRGLGSPNLVLREINRLYHSRLDTRPFDRRGIDLFERDWDNCYLLDACRYDMFDERADLPGELERVTSRASNTLGFLRANVAGRQLHDTVYVTANPRFYRYRDELDASFHDVVNVWLDDGWDDTFNTVLPGTTAEYARRAVEEYPDKRLLVHFMQPHYPFLSTETEFDKHHLHNEGEDTDDFWHEIMVGKLTIDPRLVWRQYRRTLDETLPHLRELLEAVPGRSVVTSDHGNMVGERARPLPIREWGHPKGIYTEELVAVPWHVHEDGRRSTTATEPVGAEDHVDDDVVADRLRSLGYTEGA
jgi:hypothetical protein